MSYWRYIESKSVLLTLYSDHTIFLGTRFRPRSKLGSGVVDEKQSSNVTVDVGSIVPRPLPRGVRAGRGRRLLGRCPGRAGRGHGPGGRRRLARVRAGSGTSGWQRLSGVWASMHPPRFTPHVRKHFSILHRITEYVETPFNYRNLI